MWIIIVFVVLYVSSFASPGLLVCTTFWWAPVHFWAVVSSLITCCNLFSACLYAQVVSKNSSTISNYVLHDYSGHFLGQFLLMPFKICFLVLRSSLEDNIFPYCLVRIGVNLQELYVHIVGSRIHCALWLLAVVCWCCCSVFKLRHVYIHLSRDCSSEFLAMPLLDSCDLHAIALLYFSSSPGIPLFI